MTYESHMADLKELWSEIRRQITSDVEKVRFIDQKLQEMFAAFESGEKDKGRKAAWSIYNLKVETLR